MPAWNEPLERTFHTKKKKQLRNVSLSAAAFLCLGIASLSVLSGKEGAVQFSADFEYDNTLGRLQFVSNLIPESAMVFMQGDADFEMLAQPTEEVHELHAWSVDEPWLEYACYGEIQACADATVMNVVKNHAQAYTVRLMHDDGYESVYSGLGEVCIKEGDNISKGSVLGYAEGMAAFEYRKDGLSIYPVFSESGY